MTMKAVAYYRTRPSEPEASDLALHLQREAVQRHVKKGGLHLIAEFTEREGEDGSETYPAYAAAVHAAVAHRGSKGLNEVALIIAMDAAIGTGELFSEPHIEGEGGLFCIYLQVASIPALPEITLPVGAPGPLCLYADHRPRQADTLIYLCNAGPEALAVVDVVIDLTSMFEFFTTSTGERWADASRVCEMHWDTVPPGACVLLTSRDHVFAWDMINRYRLTYTDAAGRRWAAEAHDASLSLGNLTANSDQVWVAVRPTVDQADAGEPAGQTTS